MRARAIALGALALAFAGTTSAPASADAAAKATGSLTVTLTGSTQRALAARKVKLRATGPAKRSGRRVTLPFAAGDDKALRTSGALQLRAGKRRITLGSPRLELGANARVTALVGGRRTTLLRIAVAPNTSVGGVSLRRTSATLTAGATRTIARRLKIKRLPRTTFATVAATASFATEEPAPPPQPLGSPDGPCIASTAGGTPPTPPAGEPPVKARPATARTVTGATLTWRVRESFIRYINTGEGTKTSRGATGAPPESIDGSPPLVYSFHFPFAEGWCDPVTGAARIAFTGTVAFRWAAHNIDLVVNDPEVELDGPASRVIFRMTGSRETGGGNQRAVIETLDVSKAVVDGLSYERIPGAIPPGSTGSFFGGFYLPGDPFGWVSISYTTD